MKEEPYELLWRPTWTPENARSITLAFQEAAFSHAEMENGIEKHPSWALVAPERAYFYIPMDDYKRMLREADESQLSDPDEDYQFGVVGATKDGEKLVFVSEEDILDQPKVKKEYSKKHGCEVIRQQIMIDPEFDPFK